MTARHQPPATSGEDWSFINMPKARSFHSQSEATSRSSSPGSVLQEYAPPAAITRRPRQPEGEPVSFPPSKSRSQTDKGKGRAGDDQVPETHEIDALSGRLMRLGKKAHVDVRSKVKEYDDWAHWKLGLTVSDPEEPKPWDADYGSSSRTRERRPSSNIPHSTPHSSLRTRRASSSTTSSQRTIQDSLLVSASTSHSLLNGVANSLKSMIPSNPFNSPKKVLVVDMKYVGSDQRYQRYVPGARDYFWQRHPEIWCKAILEEGDDDDELVKKYSYTRGTFNWKGRLLGLLENLGNEAQGAAKLCLVAMLSSLIAESRERFWATAIEMVRGLLFEGRQDGVGFFLIHLSSIPPHPIRGYLSNHTFIDWYTPSQTYATRNTTSTTPSSSRHSKTTSSSRQPHQSRSSSHRQNTSSSMTSSSNNNNNETFCLLTHRGRIEWLSWKKGQQMSWAAKGENELLEEASGRNLKLGLLRL